MIRKQPMGECTQAERDLIELALNMFDDDDADLGVLFKPTQRVYLERNQKN